MIFIVHCALALGLFLLINWIGKNSRSLGYISLGLFIQRDEAPAFNLALRLLGPLVYITIIAAVFLCV
jgi:membrane protein DedA with SNARE-associated domain